MPYIKKDKRETMSNMGIFSLSRDAIDLGDINPGHLNYIISNIVGKAIDASGGLSYTSVNTVVGVLECVKLELYRRLAAPYEDRKMEENGDIDPYKKLTDQL